MQAREKGWFSLVWSEAWPSHAVSVSSVHPHHGRKEGDFYLFDFDLDRVFDGLLMWLDGPGLAAGLQGSGAVAGRVDVAAGVSEVKPKKDKSAPDSTPRCALSDAGCLTSCLDSYD